MKLLHVAPLMMAAALIGCGGHDATTAPECSLMTTSYNVSTAPAVTNTPTRYDALFDAAAKEFGVSADLLKSVSYVETRWQMVSGGEEFEGRPPAFGVMALRGDRLTQGAALAGVTIEDAKHDARANIRAAAALLAMHDVASFSGIEQPEARAAYVRDVHAAEGLPVTSALLSPASNCPAPPSNVDFTSAVLRPSPNYISRPADATGGVQMIIIHTCESNYESCWGWLVDTESQVSSHYVVNESGSEVSQLVREEKRAWHIAARYDCALNANFDCALNNVQSNNFTVGVEHGGYAAQDSFPTSQLETSAKLVCDITKRHGIPRDSLHIKGHGQLQPSDRTDPGAHWPWHRYIGMIRSYCGDS